MKSAASLASRTGEIWFDERERIEQYSGGGTILLVSLGETGGNSMEVSDHCFVLKDHLFLLLLPLR